jgi:hypothetical protein
MKFVRQNGSVGENEEPMDEGNNMLSQGPDQNSSLSGKIIGLQSYCHVSIKFEIA